MCKRNSIKLIGGLLISATVGAGCGMVQRVHTSTPGALNDTPMIVDEAMQIRDWDRVSAYYANGSTVAGPTGFPYEAAWYQPEWKYPIIEPTVFVAQSIAMPVTLTITPPWTPIRYSGEIVDTSYTVMPPLPNLPQQ